jgi:hypothetical protein
MAPSTFLFGLICGANLCFPIAVPTKYAIASVIKAAKKIIYIKYFPFGSSLTFII